MITLGQALRHLSLKQKDTFKSNTSFKKDNDGDYQKSIERLKMSYEGTHGRVCDTVATKDHKRIEPEWEITQDDIDSIAAKVGEGYEYDVRKATNAIDNDGDVMMWYDDKWWYFYWKTANKKYEPSILIDSSTGHDTKLEAAIAALIAIIIAEHGDIQ